MHIVRTATVLTLAAIAGEALSAQPARQAVTGPVAVYWMSAATTDGMGGMGGGGAGGGRRPSMGAMMMGGGGMDPNAYSHTLILQLGSSRKPTAAPAAEHDPPPGLGAGLVLPLLTPQAAPTYEEHEPGPPAQYQQPKGRMLIFWGCGEHAPPGQPLIIDFAKMTPGQGGEQFSALSRGLAVTPMQPPSPARNATYGEWPNQQTRTQVPQEGSLQGAHTIKGNYSPDINFTLSANQDFLPPVKMTTNEKNPSGSATLAWRPVDGSQAYFATMFGARDQNNIVMWTSSANQTSAFALPDYLSDGEIARLVNAHALMPPSQTSCVIPVEAVQAAGEGGLYNFVAYGGESNISYPPRPPAPAAWNRQWEVKVRYRSANSGLVGMDLARMMGGGDDEDRPRHPNQQQPQQKPKKPNPFGGLGGYLP